MREKGERREMEPPIRLTLNLFWNPGQTSGLSPFPIASRTLKVCRSLSGKEKGLLLWRISLESLSHSLWFICRWRRLSEEIATKFSDVLENGGFGHLDIWPKLWSWKFASKDERSSTVPTSSAKQVNHTVRKNFRYLKKRWKESHKPAHSNANHSSGRMIKRKSAIDAIGRL